MGSRTRQSLAESIEVRHLTLDVTQDSLNFEGLPESLQGVVYCLCSITLKTFQRIGVDDFRKEFEVNHLGAVKVIQGSLKSLKTSPTGAIIILFSTAAFHGSGGQYWGSEVNELDSRSTSIKI